MYIFLFALLIFWQIAMQALHRCVTIDSDSRSPMTLKLLVNLNLSKIWV